MKRRLESLVNSDFNKYTIMLLDSVEFLIHVDDWIENQGEQVNQIKATDFVANLISSSTEECEVFGLIVRECRVPLTGKGEDHPGCL